MEITKSFTFLTDFYGSSAAKGYEGVLLGYVTKEQDKGLLSFAEQNLKKSQTIDEMITDILSIFHRDEKGYPIIGAWMVRRCMTETGKAIFNAKTNQDHPIRAKIPMAMQMITPPSINLYRNGKLIKSPDGVKTYAVTINEGGKSRSFFKAYEVIQAGVHFDCTMFIDEDLVKEEFIEYWIEKAGMVGVGAFRERFGKFEELSVAEMKKAA